MLFMPAPSCERFDRRGQCSHQVGRILLNEVAVVIFDQTLGKPQEREDPRKRGGLGAKRVVNRGPSHGRRLGRIVIGMTAELSYDKGVRALRDFPTILAASL